MKSFSKARFSILKGDGSLIQLTDEPLHNILGEGAMNVIHRMGSLTLPLSISAHLFNNRAVVPITGSTVSQTGTTISRTGTFNFTTLPERGMFVFADGTRSMATGTMSSGSCSSLQNQSVSAQAADYIKTSNNTAGSTGPGIDSVSGQLQTQSFSNALSVKNYSNGVLHISTGGALLLDPFGSTGILRRINLSFTVLGSTRYFAFDLPIDVALDAADRVSVDTWEFEATYNSYQPVEFAVSPITGITSTGRYQNLIKVGDAQNQSPNRIWLIASGSEYSIPNILSYSDSNVVPGDLTIAETITATGSNVASATSNMFTPTHRGFGTVVTGGTIGQIAWGTTTQVFGIVEFDTPPTLNPGHVIDITSILAQVADIP